MEILIGQGWHFGRKQWRIIYNHFLFDKVPIIVQTGEAIWVKLDNWGN